MANNCSWCGGTGKRGPKDADCEPCGTTGDEVVKYSQPHSPRFQAALDLKASKAKKT